MLHPFHQQEWNVVNKHPHAISRAEESIHALSRAEESIHTLYPEQNG
jgi:hypothetical protein